MKKLIYLLIGTVFLWAGCLNKLNPTKYGFYGFGEMNYGVHDVCLYDNFAFMTFNSGILSGLAEVNVSNPEYLASFTDNVNYSDGNLTKYFEDFSNISIVYTDFYNQTKLIKALNDHVVLGYTQDEIIAVVLNKDGTSQSYEKYIDYYYVNDAYNDGNVTYIAFSNGNNKFKVSEIFFNEENKSFDIKDIYEKTDEDVGYATLAADNEDIIFSTFYKVYKIKKDGSGAEDISDKFSKVGAVSMLSKFFGIYANRYLIASGGFNLYIIDLQTGDYYSKEYNTSAVAALDGNILYVVNSGYKGVIEAMDISEPLKPQILSSISNDNILAGKVVIKDGKLYIAGEWAGLMVYDVSECTQGFSESSEVTGYCITEDDIAKLPQGWNLIGSGCEITDLSLFDGVKIVWAYENGEWKAYSSDEEIMKIINEKYGVLTHINAKEGFWLYK